MIHRDWFCLALRLFGIWLFIQSLEQIVPYLAIFASGALGAAQSSSYIASMFFWLIGRTVIGFVLLAFAPAIATRFYPNAASSEAMHCDNETRPLKVGLQLLAIYALLLAIQSGSGVIIGLLSGDSWSFSQGANFNGAGTGYLASLLTFGLNLAFAAILMIWNERVVTFIEKFRYIPERDAYEPPPLSE